MNLLVLAWTLAAAIGTVLSSYLVGESLLDWRSLRAVANGRRKRAWARLVAECLRWVIHVAFFIIGGASLLEIDLGEWNLLVLVGASLLLIINSLLAVWVQRLEPSPKSVAQSTATDLVAAAKVAADEVLAVSRAAAAEILEAAKRAAADLQRAELEHALTRNAEAAERTAVNTERIAENTAPHDS